MEEKDIQALFTYIKALLMLDGKAVPRLTHAIADAWRDMFTGYTLDQLKAAARAYAMEKPYWPKPSELMEKLRTQQVETKNEMTRAPDWKAVQDLRNLYRELKEGGWLD